MAAARVTAAAPTSTIMALDAGAGARPGYDGAQGVGGGVSGGGGAMPPGADGVGEHMVEHPVTLPADDGVDPRTDISSRRSAADRLR